MNIPLKRPLLLALFALILNTPHQIIAQSKTTPPAEAIAAHSTDRFLMQDGTVLLMQGNRSELLSRNVVLPNGTKINYKSGIVEFTTGKKTTLREGDYVKMNGDIVYATPASAAAARGDNSVPATAQYNKYVERGTTATSTSVSATPVSEELPALLTRKIQLLNEKISLMTPNPANQAALNKLNRQLETLDGQINR
ncbi:DUF6799 domain-containing protein [uncultured Hymenobacter sp.]|uniref:DUF6799 domain-containing protein n=1 Tax=uncultured Hymenobacter sp. TaxID=170016 RepID=UPI0035CAA150